MKTLDNVPNLGEEPKAGAGRDAIHVAVISMLAIREMKPGEHTTNGVVDPFAKEPIKPGQRYWLMLFPNTVTSLKHVWEHPAFDNEKEQK